MSRPRRLCPGLCGLALFAIGAILPWTCRHGLLATSLLLALLASWCLALLFGAGGGRSTTIVEPLPAAPERLARAEALLVGLRVLLDQVPVPILLRTEDGALRVQNRAARMLFATDDRVLSPATALRAAIEALEPGARDVVPVQPAEGPERSFALRVAQVKSAGGIGRLAVLTDIEAELQAAEATALRGLLGVLSHEIMNSLTPVTSLAETARGLLADGTAEGTAAAADALETIGRRASGLNRFVRGYRLLSRLPAPVPRQVSLPALMREAELLFDDRGGTVLLSVLPPATDANVRMDAELTMQALLNLLVNAADAAREGAGWVRLEGRIEAGRAVMLISDGGTGVVPEQETAIFRPFFTTKCNGTGIGLVLAQQIAQGQGGSLTLEAPAPGRGACFRLVI